MKRLQKNNKFFKIIPENKTVYGKSIKKSTLNEVNSIMTDRELEVLPWYIIDDVDKSFYHTAQATCRDGDEFDEKIGMDVVAAKLDKKNHEWMARKYDHALQDMQSAMRKLEDLCNKHLKKARAIEKDLEEHYGWRKK